MHATRVPFLEALAQYPVELARLRRPHGAFRNWMQYPHPQDLAALLFEGSEVLGWACLHFRKGSLEKNPQWVLGWFIDPAYRGRGGTHLLTTALLQGLSVTRIRAQPQNPAVRQTLTRHGFHCLKEGRSTSMGYLLEMAVWERAIPGQTAGYSSGSHCLTSTHESSSTNV